MVAERRPDPPPYQTNDYAPAIVGSVLWAIAAVVLAVRHGAMAASGEGWWVWVAVVGIGIGLWGVVMVTIRNRVGRRQAAPTDLPVRAERADGGDRGDPIGS